jgi:hypothetical protein
MIVLIELNDGDPTTVYVRSTGIPPIISETVSEYGVEKEMADPLCRKCLFRFSFKPTIRSRSICTSFSKGHISSAKRAPQGVSFKGSEYS